MRFERQELRPYAEPTSANDLKIGSVYFFLNFVDDALLLPSMEPVVFIGRNLEANDKTRVYFQDADSYRQGVRYESSDKNENATIYSGSENEIGHVFEYDHALDELIRCSLRRNSTRSAE